MLAGSLLVALVCVGALIARLGTTGARVGAVALLVLTLAGWVWFLVRRSRALRRPSFVLQAILARHDAELSGRLARAYDLWEGLQSQQAPRESPELAELHVTRLLDAVRPSVVRHAGAASRRRRLWGAIGLGLVGVSVFFWDALAVVEGVDVLLARKGVGLFPIRYVDQLAVTAQWPAYLDGTKQKRFVSSRLTAVPQGSEIEVRVLSLVEGRKLLLTDGVSEVPFLSDGQGGLVARWRAVDPSELRVAARFGDVLLLDGNSAHLAPVDDRPPAVMLMGAPQQLRLDELDRLALRFFAQDDHGLSQIDLVIESGQRSDRQELAQLSGQSRVYHGGHTLTREHELIKKAFLPVRVRVEASDGNSATGPSWGKSKEYVLLPKPLGKDVAERHLALRQFRADLSRFYAEHAAASTLSSQAAHEARAQAHAALLAALAAMSERLTQTEDVPESSLAFVRAQVEALEKTGPERALPQAVLLAVDALIQRIAHNEAGALAKDLGAAVEEVAVQARELRFHAEGVRRQGLLDLLEGVKLGAEQLREVGTLGLDLGSVAQADLGRIVRSLDEAAYARAEGAAIHLAERLKRANASFSSSGGAGVESGTPSPGQGGGAATPGQQGEAASDAPSQFEELVQKLDRLAQDSAEELSELEQLLDQAARAAAADFQGDDSTAASVDELRDALRGLPATGYGPGSPRSEAAAGRAEGEGMADAMERGDFQEAMERGKNAESALERARGLADTNPGWLDAQSLRDAKHALEDALERAERANEALQRRTQSEQQKGLSERSAARGALAERARRLAHEGRNPTAPLPNQSREALERAAQLLEKAEQALQKGQLEPGLEYSEQAQSQLERALPESEPSTGDRGGEGEEGSQPTEPSHGSVPDEERDRARDFRERVEMGLGKGAGRLSPAVRRYAEELK